MQLITALTLALVSATTLVSAASAPPLAAVVKADLKKRNPKSYKIYSLSTNPNVKGTPKRLSGLLENCTAPSCFDLTLDDGPFVDHKFVADTINNAGYKGTFFVNGFNYQCIYDQDNVDRLRYSLAQGHTICSHTWGHADLSTLTFEQIDRQIELQEEALYKTIGIVPACIRPPYGSANETVVKYLNERHGLVVLNWSVDSGDSATPMATTEAQLALYRGFKAPQQVNMLQHEVYNRTAREVIPEAVKIIKANGYKRKNVQGVGTNFGFSPYKVVAKPGKRDATWTCEGKPLPGQGDPPAPAAPAAAA